ncbi:MAG TPA: aldehyde dehydrogenase family protein [Ignavibacteria bacterium]|nr:aldehyde dehydrogenase family protein [Ignavibacteria bacterium]HMR40585.1 aldehyde dehydrogenase family protein [Ignavibacteria bacterium]
MPTRLEIPKMYKLFIGGKFTRTESERYLSAINPKTKEKICNISRASRKDLRNAVVAAKAGFGAWSGKTAYERAQIMYRLAEMLEGRKDQFVEEIRISTKQTGSECVKEVHRAIDRIIYYAGFCDKWMQLTGSVNPVQTGYFNFSVPEPTGIVGIILPDNLSFLPLVSRVAAVLTGGNSCILLANDNAPLPALSFSEVIATSDFPAGVINILTGLKKEVIPHLAGHYEINAIDFCDDNTGQLKEVMELCANNVKRFHSLPKDHNWFSDEQNENLKEIEKFIEIKTVWHTVGN